MEENLKTVNAVQEPAVEAPQNPAESPDSDTGDRAHDREQENVGKTGEDQGAKELGQEDTPHSENEKAEPQETAAPAQSREENAQYAKIRRQAEREAAARAQAQIDAFYKENFAGQLNPFTGKPIESQADYLAFSQQRALEEAAQDKGMSLQEYQDLVAKVRRNVLENDPEVINYRNVAQELLAKEHQQILEKDLAEIKAAYPDEKAQTVKELGEDFLAIMSTGRISPLAAYEAVRSERGRRVKEPPSMGDVAGGGETTEKRYLTHDEVAAMTPSQVRQNYEKIRKSMMHWK